MGSLLSHDLGSRCDIWGSRDRGDACIWYQYFPGRQMVLEPQRYSVTILGPTLIFCRFCPFYSALSVTHSPLIPSCTARTATKSPDKSPDGSPDHSAVRYHMPSLRSLHHSTASLSNPLWIASSLPHHDETASSWWTLLYMTVLFCDSCDPLLLTCILYKCLYF